MKYRIVDGYEKMKLEDIIRLLKMTYRADNLCDVIIDTEYQNKGYGTALVSYIESRPCYAGLRGILITRDAHSLYRRFGYEVLNDRAMVKGLNC